MRLVARDQEAFFHLIVLLNEAGLSGVPAGGNELIVPDGSEINDAELRAEIARVVLPGSDQFASGPPGGSGAEPLSASDVMGVMAPTQTGPPINPPVAPQPVKDTPGIMGPTAMKPPPRSGPGSNIQAQRRYATSLGLDVAAGMGRDEIIALIDEYATTGGPSDG
jgi:hypothetical protein